MKFFLTGGGDQESFRELDQKFIEALPNNSRILILPMACEEDEYEDVYDRITHEFASKKISHFELCEDIRSVTFDELITYDALIFEGGNTFKLITELRECHFFKYLKDYCALDKIIYADSAGAIVLGNDVQTAFLGEDGDEDEQKLQDYRGLGVLNDWSMHCHHEDDDISGVEALMYQTGSTFICLPEVTGVMYNSKDDSIASFGERSASLVTFTGVEQT